MLLWYIKLIFIYVGLMFVKSNLITFQFFVVETNSLAYTFFQKPDWYEFLYHNYNLLYLKINYK